MPYRITLLVLMITAAQFAIAQADSDDTPEEAANKALALAFYRDLWGSENTDRYADYVAETYVVHDIGDRKNVTEPAIEQKNIADFFWTNGSLEFELDYQIAEGNLVATRWISHFEPDTLFGKFVLGGGALPIINVLRIEDDKIVEFWNHRHDIDTGRARILLFVGLAIGLLIALIPTVIAIRLRGRLRGLQTD